MGGVRVSVDAADLTEVAPVSAVAWVPCLDPALLGVALHRDRFVPVVDGRRRLGVGAAGQPPWLCVFVRTPVGEVAVPVDGVPALEPTSEARPDQAPCVDLTAIGIAGGAEDGPRAAH
jgi:chemotaxis signal transduction protein